MTGNLAFDAQMAAVLRESGINEVLAEDRDFKRLSWFSVRALSDLESD
jgi:predicted nucleic acid-binding protein